MPLRPSLVLLAVLPVGIFAQETRATLLGFVSDPSGAAIPNASVIARSVETGVEAKVSTNQAGAYEIPYLVQGTYEVAVEAQGFRRYARPAVVLGLGARVNFDAKMEVGDTGTSVSVTGDVPLLNTVNASAAQVLDNRAVMDSADHEQQRDPAGWPRRGHAEAHLQQREP